MSTPVSDRPSVTTRVAATRGATFTRSRELGIAGLIAVVFVATTVHNHDFAKAGSVQQLLTGASLIALLCVGETLVVVTRNVDLSVGSTLGLCAYVVGTLFKHQHIPVWSGFVIAIVLGGLIGSVNGFITSVLKVPSLVVTLATLYVIRGIDSLIVNGHTIDPDVIPRAFTAVGYRTVAGIPWLFVITAVVVIAAAAAMRSLPSFRDLYAIGSNPEAADLAGIPSQRRIFTAFVVSGMLAGLAGGLFLALHAQVDNSGGSGYELSTVAAVVVGGVAIFGGSGTVVGAALGAVLLNTIDQALVASRVSSFWNQAIAGGLLLVAIAIDRWLAIRATRTLQDREGAHRDL